MTALHPLSPRLDQLIEAFETLTPQSVSRLADFYAADARFKDPFNDARGRPAIARIFSHMFEQLDAPRFIVTGRYFGDGASTGEVMLRWELRFSSRTMGRGEQSIVGSTLLQFDDAGLISLHRDYWDAAEELFSKLPVLGGLTRALRRKLAAG